TSFHFQLPPPPPLSSFKRSHHHPDLHSFPTRRSSDLIPASLQHRHLDGEIAQSRRLRRAKQYLQPGPLRRQAIQQRVLASPTDNKQPLQILPGNRGNRSQHLRISLGHAVKYHVCDERNIAFFP